MENIVLQTCAINKKYGSHYALHNVDISLQLGHIYGFIGENGAGKTTLLRIISGLTFPTTGELVLFEQSTVKELEAGRRLLGSTIESPAFHPNYSAKRNLELQRILVGNPDKNIAEHLLQLVGLSDCGSKRVKDFSMGMKQRLGIALSLVGNPKMLILDEPINGLDPKGIADLREILQRLNAEQKITILLSSHILSELYLLATDYIIIHEGKILESLTHEKLEKACQKYISIRMDDTSLGVTALEKELGTANFRVMENGMVHLYDYINDISVVAKALRKHDILTTHIALSEQSLEEYYLSLIGGSYHV